MPDELLEYNGPDKIISSYEISEIIKAKSDDDIYFLSKIPKLDKLTQGFLPGEVVAMSGRTGMGKTSFCQTLTYNYALQNIPCLWFTYEIPVKYFLQKFPDLPLFYLPERLIETNLAWVEKRIIEAKAKYETKVIFLDHLHYLIPISQQANISILIGGVMRELKKMAIRHEVLIFIIAHTAKVKFDEKPGLESIRDSSFVAQESDFVLMIDRKDVDTENPEVNDSKKSKLRVLKNRRNGQRGCIMLQYVNNIFIEIENEKPEDL
jgi:replicative DNA helicase